QTEPIPFTQRNALNLEEGADRALKRVAASLREWPSYYFRIEGDALKAGDVAANTTKALERANLVLEYLTNQGIPAHRLHAEANIPGVREVRVVAMRKP